MDLKEWSKDTVMYSQQVAIIKQHYKTSNNKSNFSSCAGRKFKVCRKFFGIL